MGRIGSLVLIAVVGAGCVSSDGGAEPTSQPPVPVPTTVPVTTTTVAENAALCNGYLVLLRTGDAQPLRDSLDDARLQEALDTMLSSEGEFEAIAQAALELEDAVVTECAERYSANLTPAADDISALTTFMDAVIAGDEDAAEQVAWDHVIAQLTPWSPIDPPGGAGSPPYSVDGDTATVVVDSRTTLTCRAEGGVVVSCSYGE